MTLSYSEELNLILLAQSGDQSAAVVLFDSYKARIRFLFRSFEHHGLTADDLSQESWFPFYRAVMTFDPNSGYRLWPRVQKWIKWHLIDIQRNWLGLSDDARKRYRRVMEAYSALLRDLSRAPSAEELSLKCDVRQPTVNEILALLHGRESSLDDQAIPPQQEARIGNSGTDNPAVIVERKTIAADRLVSVVWSLGRVDGVKFLILGLLREEWDYRWDDVAWLLGNPTSDPSPGWEMVLCEGYQHLARLVPGTWIAVYDLFREPPPAITSVALRQFYSRGLRVLASNASAGHRS